MNEDCAFKKCVCEREREGERGWGLEVFWGCGMDEQEETEGEEEEK